MALTDNIISYRKCDETSGTTLADATGNGNNGTVSGDYFGAGKINNGVDLSHNGLAIRRISSSISTQVQTISWWVKFNYFTSNWVIGAQQSSSDWNGWKCRFNLNGSKATIYLKFGRTDYNTSLDITDSNRHHIVMTKDGSNVKCYLDGGTPYSVAVTWSNGGTLTIGTPSYDSISAPYCEVDEIGVWSAGISSTEVSKLYNSGAGLQYPFSDKVEDAIFFGTNF